MSDPKTNPGNETPENKNNVNILVVSPDLNLAKTVQAAFQAVAADNPEKNYRVFPAATKEKLIESLAKQTFHSVLVEEDFIVDAPLDHFLRDLLELLQKSDLNKDTPAVLVAAKTDFARTRAVVRMGWKDILLKPLDNTLFLQKMSLYNPKIPVIKEPILFTMDSEREVDLAFVYKAKTLSEYGMKIEANAPLHPGTVVGVTAPFLAEPLSAVVLDNVKIGDGQFTVRLMFVGITPAETQAIRKLIRQEYAEEKQAA